MLKLCVHHHISKRRPPGGDWVSESPDDCDSDLLSLPEGCALPDEDDWLLPWLALSPEEEE